MRITFEPTGEQRGRSVEATHPKVTIEHPSDDLSLDNMRELIDQALRAFGYAWSDDEDE